MKSHRSFPTGNRAWNHLDIFLNKKVALPYLIECRCKEGEETGYLDTPGGRIQKARLNRFMALVDVSALTGLTTATLSNIGKNRCRAALDNLCKLSKALDVPLPPYIGCFEKLPEKTLGQRIRKARYYHDLTKEEMAWKIGVNTRTIYDWKSEKEILSRNI